MRTIEYVRVTGRRDLIEVEFSADGFLYKMVRLMVGSIARCALGKETLQSIELRLERPSRTIRASLPLSGLKMPSRIVLVAFFSKMMFASGNPRKRTRYSLIALASLTA